VTACREWPGYKILGYGMRYVYDPGRRRVAVHRWVMEHLRLGTHQDNMEDMVQKGRVGKHQRARGSKASNARLTEAQVAEIRLLLEEGVPQKEIALRYGVGQPNISMIKTGKNWHEP